MFIAVKAYKVAARMSLDADYNTIVEGRVAEVKEQLKQQLAGILGAPAASVKINRLSPGTF